MSSASHPEGLAIARELISREAEARTGVLDLGGLGLKAMPEELRRLTHLRGLNLGDRWVEPRSRSLHRAAQDLGKNDLREGWEILGALTSLEELHFSRTQVSDLQPLAQLTALTTLDCSGTQVSDLQPLAQLTALTSLSCILTQITDLQPLAQLTKLTTLHCFNNQVSDLRPLAQLTALSTLYCSLTQVSDLRPLAQLTALTTLNC